MLTRHASNTLMRALIAISILCALTQAAPAGVSTAADEGLATASTLEISTDLGNSLPNVYATTDTVYNAQAHAGTEFVSADEWTQTTLPTMTRAEMSLAEIAAVVAELASTTADEMKTTVEEEDKLLRRRAEEARRGAIAREIANTVEAGEGEPIDEKDFIAITTYRSNFLNAMGVTQAPVTSVSPYAATTTTAAIATTNSSPEILNELVRAASAANEILAAALNVATMAVTNMTVSDTTTTSYETMQTTKTNDKSIATTNSVGAAIADEPTLMVLSDGDTLPEPIVKWQTSKGVKASIPIEITTAAITTMQAEENFATANTEMLETTTQASENETTNKALAWNETKSEVFLTKPTATESQINQQEIPATFAINEQTIELPKMLERAPIQIGLETAAYVKTEKPLANVETTDDSAHEQADNEAAESLQIITKETTTEAAALARGANEVESETFNFYYASSTGTQQLTTTPTPNKFETNAIEHEEIEIAKNIVWDTTTPVSLAAFTQGTENEKEKVEIEIAKVQELKLGSNYENNQKQKANQEGAATTTTKTIADHERVVTNEITTAAMDVPITTTEPLETLIAVESEARIPTQIVIAAEEEKEHIVELAPFTTALPEAMTAMETVSEVVQKDISTENATTQETILVGEITSETQTRPALSSQQQDVVPDKSPNELLATKVEPEVSTAESENHDSGAATNDELEEAASTDSQSMTTEAPKRIETLETSTDLPTLVKDTLVDNQTETIIETESLTSSYKSRLGFEEKGDAATELQAEPLTTEPTVELASVERTTPFSNTATTNQVQIIETREPVTNAMEQSAALDFASNVIKVPLAPFTTTTTNPTITEEPTTFTTTKSDNAAAADIGSTASSQTASISSDRTTTTADSILSTTLNSNSETTNTAAANELATEHANKGDNIISVTTTSDTVVETTTTIAEAPATVTELSLIATTIAPKPETTTDTVESEQLFYMISRYQQQPQQEANKIERGSTVDTVNGDVEAEKPVEAAKEIENETTTEADVREQFLYMRVLNGHQRPFAPMESTKIAEEATKVTTTAASTTTNMNESDSLTTTSTSEPEQMKTTTEELDTTTTPETITTIITSTTRASETTTTTTTPENTTSSTTTTTTTTPETTTSSTTTTATIIPETTTSSTTTTTTTTPTPTTTTTPEPETTTTTTTTTTLSPMSLIIAEHEARALDKTPSRVSRIVNDDGVEVLSGYSIVHRMHAAALSAWEAMKGA